MPRRLRPHLAHVQDGVAVEAACLLLRLAGRQVVLEGLVRLLGREELPQREGRDHAELGPRLRLLHPVPVVEDELVAAADARQGVAHQHRLLHVGVFPAHCLHVVLEEAGVVMRAAPHEVDRAALSTEQHTHSSLLTAPLRIRCT